MMEQSLHTGSPNSSSPDTLPALKPIKASERIQALDVIRGFALIGIFFMNIEWFNRSFLTMGTGIPADVHGIDWLASYFVNFFVAGKFWTIFSLLFGMGFAVMLSRSEATGRAFIKPYIRRIIALAIFGILHNVLLWPGDILYSYAFTAAGLLIILFGQWKWVVASIVGLIGVCFIPGMGSFSAVVGGIAFMGFIAIFIRNERIVSFLGMKIPLFSAICLVIASLLTLAAIASWVVPAMRDARNGLTGMTVAFFVIAFLSAKFHQPAEARFWRAGVLIYSLPFAIGLVFGVIAYQQPLNSVFNSPEAVKLAAEKQVKKEAEEAAEKLAKASPDAGVKKAEKKDLKEGSDAAEKKKAEAPKSEAQKKLERDADTINRINENRKNIEKDLQAMTKASYPEFVKHRFADFMDGAFNAAGQAFAAIALFLIGVWFVRAQVITKAGENLHLFRQIVLLGLPLGWGMSLLASSIAVSHAPGVSGDGWQLTQMILNLANLPTCLAYVSIVVLMLYSGSIFAKIQVLAPFGRMALTNYLTQSVIQASFFYGWGLGNFGLGRAQQLGFAVAVICSQVLFSHWWLGRFRYGPLEWVWRAVTYWEMPAMKIERTDLYPQVSQ
ncbi:DUF418 domain-containing protein [Undibacterium amnicola]|uniref:DUF418 domain-containing protein n=1 Tax=Undibacterium amnicola TaxID=1834038 RepID=A0ABR6XM02_9BURK|nr:DUF418 domain-containing protein [Undibacterium amnicola]MBC3830019.1 DUF418 domain-containing protein [Undibacterium amnicola]